MVSVVVQFQPLATNRCGKLVPPFYRASSLPRWMMLRRKRCCACDAKTQLLAIIIIISSSSSSGSGGGSTSTVISRCISAVSQRPTSVTNNKCATTEKPTFSKKP